MKTERYIGMELDFVHRHDAWGLMKACVDGDMDRVAALVGKDGKLVNAQYGYQIPLHFAVREGHAGIVEFLLGRR